MNPDKEGEYQLSVKPINADSWRDASKLEGTFNVLLEGRIVSFKGTLFRVTE